MYSQTSVPTRSMGTRCKDVKKDGNVPAFFRPILGVMSTSLATNTVTAERQHQPERSDRLNGFCILTSINGLLSLLTPNLTTMEPSFRVVRHIRCSVEPSRLCTHHSSTRLLPASAG